MTGKRVSGVTIVIPTLDREAFVLVAVTDLMAQPFRPIEILIVDQSDRPSSAILELESRHPDMITYRHVTRFRGLPQARNYGWRKARHDAILFIDDDVRCGVELVAQHARSLSRPGVGVVAGGIEEAHRAKDLVTPVGKFRYWTATPLRGFGGHGEFEVDHAPGGNFSVWREVLLKCGGIDESLSKGAALYEETEFCLRARAGGYRIMFNGGARLTHLAAATGGCRVEDITRYMRGLSHNRMIVIRRGLSWYHWPTAAGRLLCLVASHAWTYREPAVVLSSALGVAEGFSSGGRPPVDSSSEANARD